MMQHLELTLGERRCPVHIGSGLLHRRELLDSILESEQIFVLSDSNVAPLYLQRLCKSLGDRQLSTRVLPAGESSKNLASLEQVYTQLLEDGHHRDTTLLALGGGMIGDLTGFAAASYQRGVSFIQLPTTLLAQVDASIGGKTGVNHPLGKNMIGAFHQPHAVLIDIETLHSLPQREFRAGLAEVIKYGLIRDSDFFDWLEKEMHRLVQREEAVLSEAVYRSCANKIAVVAADEQERGSRALLNLGHTFGHAIETAQNYQGLLHGEAVAVGIGLAARLSCELGLLPPAAPQRIDALLRSAGLSHEIPAGLDPRTLVHLMRNDKKVMHGRLRLILLQDIGRAVIEDSPGEELLHSLLCNTA